MSATGVSINALLNAFQSDNLFSLGSIQVAKQKKKSEVQFAQEELLLRLFSTSRGEMMIAASDQHYHKFLNKNVQECH